MLTIKPSWNPFIQRLQTEAAKHNGCAVVTISFVVDQNGNVLFWSEPTSVRIEPQNGQEAILTWFGRAKLGS